MKLYEIIQKLADMGDTKFKFFTKSGRTFDSVKSMYANRSEKIVGGAIQDGYGDSSIFWVSKYSNKCPNCGSKETNIWNIKTLKDGYELEIHCINEETDCTNTPWFYKYEVNK